MAAPVLDAGYGVGLRGILIRARQLSLVIKAEQAGSCARNRTGAPCLPVGR